MKNKLMHFFSIVIVSGSPCLSPAIAQTQSAEKFLELKLVAGSIDGPGATDGKGKEAQFGNSYSDVGVSAKGTAIDKNGNLYVADIGNHTIRKVTTDGVVTTIAGKAGVAGSEDGTESEARFRYPMGLAIDNSGNLFVTDSGNYTIRKISPSGIVTTLAGSPGKQGSANGDGVNARFMRPKGIAVDGNGIIYVADTFDATIRRISPTGVVTTLAGRSQVGGYRDGVGNTALFANPLDVAVSPKGDIYVADEGNSAIRKITFSGHVTTYLNPPATQEGMDADGRLNVAGISAPEALAFDSAGNLFVSEIESLRKIGTDGYVTTIAGMKSGPPKSVSGIGKLASFSNPGHPSIDKFGNLYVADDTELRKVMPDGNATSFAGSSTSSGYRDGHATVARFNQPRGITSDKFGNLYVDDSQNGVIRKISASGEVTTLAGTIAVHAHKDGIGVQAQLDWPTQILSDASGNVYFTEANAHVVRKIDVAGIVTTIAGVPGEAGLRDGIGIKARFNKPSSIALDEFGHLFVYDAGSGAFREVDLSTFSVKTLEKKLRTSDNAPVPDDDPKQFVLDSNENIYFSRAATIRKVNELGRSSILAGRTGIVGSRDGDASNALFSRPSCLARDGIGNIFVCDGDMKTYFTRIRKIDPEGTVSTLVGSQSSSGITLGHPGLLDFVSSITVISEKQIALTSGHAVLVVNLP